MPEKAYRGRSDDFQGVPLQDKVWTHRWICRSYNKTSLWSMMRNFNHSPSAVLARSCWSNSHGMTGVVDAAFVIQDRQIGHHYCTAWIFIFLKRKLQSGKNINISIFWGSEKSVDFFWKKKRIVFLISYHLQLGHKSDFKWMNNLSLHFKWSS